MLNLQSLFRNKILMSSKNLLYVIGFFILFQSYLFATTYYVDGSVTGGSCTQADPCELIQTAIDLATTDSDIVIVTGGMTYEENLLIETGITLKSADPLDPATIDGSNSDEGTNGSCIIIRSPRGSTTRITPTIQDMIITGGTGTLVNEDVDHDGIYNGDNDEQKKVGGGILVHNASMTSRRNNIKYNGSSGTEEGGAVYAAGSGIEIEDDNPELPPPPVFNTRSTIIFDETVFENNTAHIGHTLMANSWDPELGRSIDFSFPGSTFDVAFIPANADSAAVSEYWVNGKDGSTFNFSGGIASQGSAITWDVWVNPEIGSDYYEGTESNPFQTINHALSFIYGTEDNPVVIYLSSGVYSPTNNEEIFPLGVFNWISLVGAGEELSILNAEQISRVILLDNCENNTISDLKITGGSASGSWDAARGGGMYLSRSNSELNNLIITENSANSSGGMYFSYSNANLTNVRISNNTAGYAAGIYLAYSDPIMTDVMITGNTAVEDIGGMKIWNSNPTMTNVTVNDNTAGENAGGISMINSNPIMTNVSVNGNTAGSSWGGMLISSSNPIISHLTIGNNTANNHGGLKVIYSDIIMSHLTISNNVDFQNFWGGVHIQSSNVNILNSIFWANSNGSITTSGSGITLINYSDIEGGFEGEGNINANPLFTNSTNGDFTLQDGSPCIDAGTDDLDSDGYPEVTDYFGSAPDLGAYEFEQIIGCQNELGDSNGDGGINVLDIVIMVAAILGNGTEYNDCMDVNGDGTVNILDIVILVAIILNP